MCESSLSQTGYIKEGNTISCNSCENPAKFLVLCFCWLFWLRPCKTYHCATNQQERFRCVIYAYSMRTAVDFPISILDLWSKKSSKIEFVVWASQSPSKPGQPIRLQDPHNSLYDYRRRTICTFKLDQRNIAFKKFR